MKRGPKPKHKIVRIRPVDPTIDPPAANAPGVIGVAIENSHLTTYNCPYKKEISCDGYCSDVNRYCKECKYFNQELFLEKVAPSFVYNIKLKEKLS